MASITNGTGAFVFAMVDFAKIEFPFRPCIAQHWLQTKEHAMHDRELTLENRRGAAVRTSGPTSIGACPGRRRSSAFAPFGANELTHGGTCLADCAVLRPVQEHADHHPARRNGAVRVAGRGGRRSDHRDDRTVLRRAQLRAGIPRRPRPQGAQAHAGPNDHGSARRRGADAFHRGSSFPATSCCSRRATAFRPTHGWRRFTPSSATKRPLTGESFAVEKCLTVLSADDGGRRSAQRRLRRDHRDLRSRQGDRDGHRR